MNYADVERILVPHKLSTSITGLMTALHSKEGFDGPAGIHYVAEMAYAMHEHALPPVTETNAIAYLIEIEGWGDMPVRTAASWKYLCARYLRMGMPFGIEEEGRNPEIFPVSEISPKPGARAHTNSSADELAFHVELAALPAWCRPRHLSLLCMVNKAEAATGLVSAASIDAHINPTYRRVLREDRFVCKTPPSLSGTEAESEPRPVIIDTPSGIGSAIRFDLTRVIEPYDAEAAEALAEAERLANTHAMWICLKPGQLLFFDNLRAMHARKPIGSGERRLLRAYWHPNTMAMNEIAGTPYATIISAKRALNLWSMQ